MKCLRILVCGDRFWTNKELIEKELLRRRLTVDQIFIIEGEAPGADTLAREIAKQYEWPFRKFPANWKKFGLAAGPIRNAAMLKKGKPDLVLAFHNNIQGSKGTRNMVEQARKAGISVEVVTDLGD